MRRQKPRRNGEDDATRSDASAPEATATDPIQSEAPTAPSQPAAEYKGPRIGEVLVAAGKVTDANVEDALRTQEEGVELPLGRILIARGVTDERAVTEGLATQYGVAVIDLRVTKPETAALETLDGDTARELRVLPVHIGERGLVVAVDHIPDLAVIERVHDLTGLDVGFVLVPPVDLERTLAASYRALADVDQYVRAFEAGTAGRGGDVTTTAVHLDESAPVVQVVSRILTEAVRERASDIHIEPQEDRLRVRFRVDGALHEPIHLPGSMAQALVSRLKIMSDMNIVEKRRAQDGQFEFNADGHTLDVRVATVSTIWGEKVVLRLLDRSRSLLELSGLGMPVDLAAQFERIIRSPFGMVICAGPTGSGKTTTLYAALNEVNDPERNIMTIEDPVEYVFPEINQMQINEIAGITFAGGLKAILRQDPDVILVGEIRDVETARIAVQSALTGHLVLSSLHATDTISALQRLLDMGIESFLVASSVNAIVGQRLVRRICTQCAAPYEPSAEELAFYEESGGPAKSTFLRGEGCNFCAQTGYSDRTGVFEMLRVSDEIRELVVHNAPYEKLRATALEQGMHTMRDGAIQLVENDVTTISEVLRRIYSF